MFRTLMRMGQAPIGGSHRSGSPIARKESTLAMTSIWTPGAVVHTTFAGPAVAAFAAATFAIDGPITARLVSRGFNDVYEIAGARRFFLRIGQHGRRSLRDAESEGQALAEVKVAGASVVVAIRGRNGSFAQPVAAPEGRRAALLFEPARGIEGQTGQAAAQGGALAQIHAVRLSDPTAAMLRRLDLDSLVLRPAGWAGEVLGDRPDLACRLLDVATAFVDRFAPLTASLGVGFCHGDFHGGNALVEDGVATLLDFDDCGMGWFAYDLASFLWTCQGFEQEHREAIWADFLLGYESVRPLAEADRKAVEPLILVREIWALGAWATGAPHWGDSWFRTEDFALRIPAVEERLRRLVEARLI